MFTHNIIYAKSSLSSELSRTYLELLTTYKDYPECTYLEIINLKKENMIIIEYLYCEVEPLEYTEDLINYIINNKIGTYLFFNQSPSVDNEWYIYFNKVNPEILLQLV